MTELLKVDDTGHEAVVLTRKIDSVPSGLKSEYSAAGFTSFSKENSVNYGNERARIVSFYDQSSQNTITSLTKNENSFNRSWKEELLGIVVVFPILMGAFAGGMIGSWIAFFLFTIIIMGLAGSWMLREKSEIENSKPTLESAKSKLNYSLFSVSGVLYNNLENFIRGNFPQKCHNHPLLNVVHSKMKAEQSDEELIEWMKTVELILFKDEKFPIDLIPVESEEAADVLAQMPDKRIERSPELEKLALEGARTVADQLKHDSVALRTGALRYLGVEE